MIPLLIEHIPPQSEIQDMQMQLNKMLYTHWRYSDLFSPYWWFLLMTLFLPFFLWWKLVDKGRFFEIFAFGLLSALIAIFLDAIGISLGKWNYPTKVFVFITTLIPADVSIIPVTLMLLYQYTHRLRLFFPAIVIWAAALSFLVEPAFIYLGLFSMNDWKHTYSYLDFILYGMIVRLLFFLMWRGVQKNTEQKKESAR